MNSTNSTYNLTRLKAFVGDDPDVIAKMVQVFLKSANDLIGQLIEGEAQHNTEKIYHAVHALKPSLDIFGIDDMHQPVRELEKLAQENTDVVLLEPLLQQLITRTQHFLKQLQVDFNT